MSKQLNIKSLAKGMRVEDKAKLFFADTFRWRETNGREGILTPEDEKALIEDAQNLNQIGELNRLNRLFHAAGLLLVDVQTAYLNFELAQQKVLTILIGMLLANEAADKLDRAIRDLACQGYSKEQIEDEKFQEEIEDKTEKLYEEYKEKDNFSTRFDYFTPSLRDEKFPSQLESQPNPILQQAFMETVNRVKKFKTQVFQLDYVRSQAGIELLSDKDNKNLEDLKNDIQEFVDLKSPLNILQFYKAVLDKKLVKATNFKEPKFLEAITDMSTIVSLTTEEQETARQEISRLLEKHM